METRNRNNPPVRRPTSRNGQNRGRRRKHKKNRLLPAVIILAVFVILTVVLLRSCRKGDALQGQWRIDEVTAYRFDGKGEGALVLPDLDFPFRYTIKKDILSIDFESESARDFSYTFRVDGDQLTLTGGEGDEDVSYLLIRETEE